MAGHPAEEVEAFVARQDSSYWLRTDAARQVAHAELVSGAAKDHKRFAYEVKTEAFTSHTEVMLWTPDRPGLAAIIAGACAAAGGNIVGADITTTRDSWALNSVFLQRNFEDENEELEWAGRIGQTIEAALRGERDMAKIMAKKVRPQPRLDAFTVEPRVTIDNSLSDELTVIEVNARDCTGLLYEITHALADLHVDISSAHIATFGEKVVDVFYVTDAAHREIVRERTQGKVREKLLAAISAKPDGEGEVAKG
jgi:[protein-PII] uridylyltransferase